MILAIWKTSKTGYTGKYCNRCLSPGHKRYYNSLKVIKNVFYPFKRKMRSTKPNGVVASLRDWGVNSFNIYALIHFEHFIALSFQFILSIFLGFIFCSRNLMRNVMTFFNELPHFFIAKFQRDVQTWTFQSNLQEYFWRSVLGD